MNLKGALLSVLCHRLVEKGDVITGAFVKLLRREYNPWYHRADWNSDVFLTAWLPAEEVSGRDWITQQALLRIAEDSDTMEWIVKVVRDGTFGGKRYIEVSGQSVSEAEYQQARALLDARQEFEHEYGYRNELGHHDLLSQYLGRCTKVLAALQSSVIVHFPTQRHLDAAKHSGKFPSKYRGFDVVLALDPTQAPDGFEWLG